MYLHKIYFTNYGSWLFNFTHSFSSAHYVSFLTSQSIINVFIGDYHTGLTNISGLFYLVQFYGIINLEQMKALIFFTL